MYICIKRFELPIIDIYGCETDEYRTVREGDKFNLYDEDNYRFIGGEVRLESEDRLDWLEISQQTFKEYFREEPNNGI